MKIAKAVALGLAWALAAAGTASAQPKQFVQVTTIHAKPDGAMDY